MLFKTLYNKTDELMKRVKEPFAAKKLQRSIESAIDNCVQEILTLQEKFLKQLDNVVEIDLNEFKKTRWSIDENQKDIEFLQELYKILFGKEYDVPEDLGFEECVKTIEETK